MADVYALSDSTTHDVLHTCSKNTMAGHMPDSSKCLKPTCDTMSNSSVENSYTRKKHNGPDFDALIDSSDLVSWCADSGVHFKLCITAPST